MTKLPLPPNLRCAHSCYECLNNKNRLDVKETEKVECEIYTVSPAFISMDWVCDDYRAHDL